MQLFSWFTKRMTGRPQNRRAPACRPAPRFRPHLEVLEERLALSTLTVTNTLDSGRGSLRYEIAQASTINDTIIFSPSLDGQTIKLTSGELDIAKNLTIQGPGAGQLTISGGRASRVFEVNYNENVTLSGLTISGGNVGYAVNGPYGLIYSQGGGIFNRGTLTLSGDTLSGNTASYGGGILNMGALTVNNGCMLSGNTAFIDGGGIYNSRALTVSGSTLSGNSAYHDGGGVYNGPGATLTINGCTLSGNYTVVASSFGNGPRVGGGGVYNTGRLTALNSIFSGNYDQPEYSNIMYPDNILNLYGRSYYTDGGGNIFS